MVCNMSHVEISEHVFVCADVRRQIKFRHFYKVSSQESGSKSLNQLANLFNLVYFLTS